VFVFVFVFVFVYMILTLFFTGVNPCKTPRLRPLRVTCLRHIFITHLSICHSFLDVGLRPPREPPTAYGIIVV